MPRPAGLTPIDPEAVAWARAAAPPAGLLMVVAETFQTLDDPARARIFYARARRPLCVRDLAVLVGVSESAISHQLRLLWDSRLVKPRRAGHEAGRSFG